MFRVFVQTIFFLSELSRHLGIYTRQCETGSAPRLQVPHQGKTNGWKINSLFAFICKND
jgi:hypothetical protein